MNQKPIAIWLLLCCVTVFAMIILGGVTRLTGSGLSMVEWKPILGVIPPIGEAQWNDAFVLYQQFPEFRLKNADMSLAEFKSIFWLEYAHRLLGRSVGMIFLLPFVFFVGTNKINKTLIPKLIILFVLGGLQGLMGWYMVQSGLVNNPLVSQYRLTAHLMLAITIYSYLFWLALDILFSAADEVREATSRFLSGFSLFITGMVFVTLTTGGFVAGTHAGLVYNTFPLMDGQLIPAGLFKLTPVWLNLFENAMTVQFDHRVMATLLTLAISIFWWTASRSRLVPRIHLGVHFLFAVLALQVALGISTLLLRVPVVLAAAHQTNAILLLTLSLFISHRLRGHSTD